MKKHHVKGKARFDPANINNMRVWKRSNQAVVLAEEIRVEKQVEPCKPKDIGKTMTRPKPAAGATDTHVEVVDHKIVAKPIVPPLNKQIQHQQEMAACLHAMAGTQVSIVPGPTSLLVTELKRDKQNVKKLLAATYTLLERADPERWKDHRPRWGVEFTKAFRWWWPVECLASVEVKKRTITLN